MRANISIDISLLAIVLAMYFTKQDNKMILVLVAALVSHVIITSDFQEHGRYSRQVYLVGAGAEDSDDAEEDEEEQEQEGLEDVIDESLDADPETETDTLENVLVEEAILTPMKQFKTTVSSGVFDRTISTPQTQLTSAIFPSSSSEANGKLANARGSFFETLVS